MTTKHAMHKATRHVYRAVHHLKSSAYTREADKLSAYAQEHFGNTHAYRENTEPQTLTKNGMAPEDQSGYVPTSREYYFHNMDRIISILKRNQLFFGDFTLLRLTHPGTYVDWLRTLAEIIAEVRDVDKWSYEHHNAMQVWLKNALTAELGKNPDEICQKFVLLFLPRHHSALDKWIEEKKNDKSLSPFQFLSD